MKADYTDITIIIDRSGSMQGKEADVIGGFDKLVEDQKKAPGTATMSLIQFDDHYEPNFGPTDIQQVRSLVGQYHPRGSTALLDALGKTIVTIGERIKALDESQRPEKVVVIIFTDGYENASHEYRRQQVFDMIKHQREVYKWEVVFIGADMDAIAESAQYGIGAINTVSSNSTPAGMAAAYSSVSDNLFAVRSHTKSEMTWTTEEQDQIKNTTS